MNEMAQNYGISEAAEILKVTDKTIRNYINKGFLKPEKWNGSWRISHTEISEIFWKKFGKKLDQDGGIGIETQNQIIVEKTEYEDQQRDLGKLSALELNEKTLRANIQELNERNAQLEASAASGWTEARAIKEEVDRAREELKAEREAGNEAREDATWLRRELDQAQIRSDTQNTLIKDLRAENERLAAQLYDRAVGL